MSRRSNLKELLLRFSPFFVAIFLVAGIVWSQNILPELTVSGNITVGGTVDGRDVAADGGVVDSISTNGADDLTAAEVTQLQNIDSSTISGTQWGHVGSNDQDVAVADTPTFAGANLTSDNTLTHISTPSNPSAGFLKTYAKSDDQLYILNSAGSETALSAAEVINSDAAVVRSEAARINCDATPSVPRELGDWIDNGTPVTQNATGDCTVNLLSGIFSTAPFCTCTALNNALRHCQIESDPSTASVRVLLFNAADAAVDNDFHLVCIGVD